MITLILPYLLSVLGGAVPAAWLASKWYAARIQATTQAKADTDRLLDDSRRERAVLETQLAALTQANARLLSSASATARELSEARKVIEERSGPGQARADLAKAFP